MLHRCRFGIGNILESHPISGIDLILCFGCPVDTADIDLTGIIIRINGNLIRLVMLCAHMQYRIMCTETCQQLCTANSTVLIRQVVECKIIRGDILRGSEHFLVLGGNLLIGRVILHIGYIRQIIGQTVLLGKLLDRRRIVFRPVFAVFAVQNGGCVYIQRHNADVMRRAAVCLIQHIEMHTAVLILADADRIMERKRQLKRIVQHIIAVCHRVQGFVTVYDGGRLPVLHGVQRRRLVLNVTGIGVFQHQCVQIRLHRRGGKRLAHALRHGVRPAVSGFGEHCLLICQRILHGAVRIDQPIGELYAAGRLVRKRKFDGITDCQLRQFAGYQRTSCVRTDAELLFPALGGDVLHHADRLPVARGGFLQLHLNRRTGIAKCQLYNGSFCIAVAFTERTGRPPDDLGVLHQHQIGIAAQRHAEILHSRLCRIGVASYHLRIHAVDVLRHGRPRQTGRIVRPEQFALRHVVRTEFADIADHRAVFVLADGLHGVRRARIIHAAARQTEYNTAAIFVIGGYKHEIRCRRRGRTVFPRPLLAAGHSHLLRDKVFLTVRRQNREDILCALVQNCACVLLREIRRRAGTNAAAVRPVLRQPALTELVDHRDNNLAVILKRECHLADVVVRCRFFVAALNLTGRRREPQQHFCRLGRVADIVAVCDFPLVAVREKIRQTEVILIQQLKFIQRSHAAVFRHNFAVRYGPLSILFCKGQLLYHTSGDGFARILAELSIRDQIGVFPVQFDRITEVFRLIRLFLCQLYTQLFR